MTGELIAQLIIAFGPTALELIPKLAQVWSRELSPQEVIDLCAPAHKSWSEYRAEALATLNQAR